MATFEINGEQRTVEQADTVAELLRVLELHERRVAVMVEGEIVRRAQHDSATLADGAKIELIQMVGGG